MASGKPVRAEYVPHRHAAVAKTDGEAAPAEWKDDTNNNNESGDHHSQRVRRDLSGKGVSGDGEPDCSDDDRVCLSQRGKLEPVHELRLTRSAPRQHPMVRQACVNVPCAERRTGSPDGRDHDVDRTSG